MKKGIWVGKILMMVVIGVAIAFGFAIGTMYLWNWLVPALFAGPMINFWQTVGLLVLSKILFSGFGKGGHWGSYRGGPWRPYWKEKWNTMTPEDRERFKQKMKEKWCYREESPSVKDSGTSNV
ncbi:MAG: hypothetical protein AABY93_02040 [Bacteroidota bacterium]